MSRLSKKSLEQLTEAERSAYEKIVAERPVKPKDGHIGGPFDVWLRSPEMATRLVGLGGFFRFRTSVDRRYVELAILVTGQFWQAQFEWFAHEPMAREAGVPDEVIAAIKRGDKPDFDDPADEAAYLLASELHNTHQLSDETFALAVQQFDEIGVSELIGLCGFYGLVSMTLNGFDVPVPDGVEKPFA